MPAFSAIAATLAATAAATTAGAGAAVAGTAATAAAGAAGTAAAAGSALGAGAAAAAGAGAGLAAPAVAAGGALGGGSLAAGLSAATGLAGLGLQAAGTMQQMAAAKDQQRLQQMAEKARAAQMNLETTRNTRAAIRQGLVARSTALTNATGQGAAQGSGLQGGFGQISGQTGNNVLNQSFAQGFGENMFRLNSYISDAQTSEANGRGLSAVGGALFNGQDTFGKLGAYTLGGGWTS